jgi:O-antigen/teichoic acid export membrane protein
VKAILGELLRKSLVYGLGASLNSAVGFVLIPYFVERLQAAEYGAYAIAEMVLSLLLIPLGLGFNVSVLARYPQVGPSDRRRFVGGAIGFLLVSTSATVAVFVTAFLALRRLGLHELSTDTVLLVAGIGALETLWMLVATVFRAEGWAWRFIAASLVQVLASLASTIFFISYVGMRGNGILAGRLMGDVIVCAFVVLPVALHSKPRWDRATWGPLLRIGLPLMPATLASTWILMSPRYFLLWFATQADVGVFAMSAKVAGVLSIGFVQPFAMAWMVLLFQIARRPDAQRVYGRVLTYYVLVGGGLACALSLAGQIIVPFLSREAFPLSTTVLSVMALATVASGLMYPVNIGPYVREQTGLMSPTFVMAGVLVTGLGGLLTWLFGANGAATALLLVFLVQGVLLFRLSQRLYPIILERTRLLKVVLALAGAGAMARAVGLQVPASDAGWVGLAVFTVLAPLMLVVMRFPEPGETAWVRALANGVPTPRRRR